MDEPVGPNEFSHTPGLSKATSRMVGGITVKDLTDTSQTALRMDMAY